MSIVFSAVVLFLIFLPGFILRRVYLSYPFSRRYSVSSPFDDTLAIVLAVILHAAMCGAVVALTRYRIDFSLLAALIVGTHSDDLQTAAFLNLQSHLSAIAVYNLALWAIAAFLGGGIRRLVIKFELDLRFLFLRFSNDWYYLLTGREWGLKQGSDFDLVWLDALVEAAGQAIIYSGRLRSFFLARDGGLDSICISEAQKWTSPGALAPIPIPGQGFIIKYSDTLNLNIVFYRLGP
jgi:hypothetical protein